MGLGFRVEGYIFLKLPVPTHGMVVQGFAAWEIMDSLKVALG